MVARLWDAFADVTWGRFIDTRKVEKWEVQTLDFENVLPARNCWDINVRSYSWYV